MPEEQPTSHHAVAEDAPLQAPGALASEPEAEQSEWIEDSGELPRRPRRRLLTPVPLTLLAVLLIACGFIAGVLVEKGESSSPSSSGTAASLASRFAALRGRAAGTGATSTGSAAASGSSSGTPGSSAGFGRPTLGQVAFLSGSTLYVTNSEGNTVKVSTSAGTSVTKTVKASVKSIHPGETVSVTGETGSNGSVNAESISVGSAGGGLAALLGGAARGSGGGSGASSSGAGGTPSLFGSG